MVMKSWIEEVTEERLIQQFNVQPGDLYRIIENAKWLLHATDEISRAVWRQSAFTINQRIG